MFLSQLPPNFDAALRDVASKKLEFRLAAAKRLADPPEDRIAEALEALRTLCRDDTARVRAHALESIGGLSHPASLPLLQAGMNDLAPLVREAAMRGLIDQPDAAALRVLEHATESEHAEVRFHAVGGLAQRAPDTSLSRISAALLDPDTQVRLQAISAYRVLLPEEALVQRQDDTAVKASQHCEKRIAPLLSDGDPAVRFEAALTLTACRSISPLPEAALPELLGALDRRDWALDAALAVSELAHQQRLAHDGPLALRALTKKAIRFGGNAHLKVACAVGLVMLGDLRGVSLLRKAIRSRWNPARPFAVELAGRFCIRPLRGELSELEASPKGLVPELVEEALRKIPPRLAPPKSAEEQLRHAP